MYNSMLNILANRRGREGGGMADYTLRLTQEKNLFLSANDVRRLIDERNSDAALLYLCLQIEASNAEALRARLGWDEKRFDAAGKTLGELGLVHTLPQFARRNLVPPEPTLPDYPRADIMNTLERDKSFANLLREVENKLGPLSEPSLRKLLGLYDFLGLPADVIWLLVNYCAERKAEQFGAEKPPTMREIEKTGYAWARMELFSQEAASAYIRREHERRSRYGAYMEALRLGKRAPVASEEKYLAAWADWGFPPETLAVAYDRTVLNCHEFKWPYCNGLLKRWHEKGIHTPEQAQNETGRRRPANPTAAPAAGGDKNAWMDEYLK